MCLSIRTSDTDSAGWHRLACPDTTQRARRRGESLALLCARNNRSQQIVAARIGLIRARAARFTCVFMIMLLPAFGDMRNSAHDRHSRKSRPTADRRHVATRHAIFETRCRSTHGCGRFERRTDGSSSKRSTPTRCHAPLQRQLPPDLSRCRSGETPATSPAAYTLSALVKSRSGRSR